MAIQRINVLQVNISAGIQNTLYLSGEDSITFHIVSCQMSQSCHVTAVFVASCHELRAVVAYGSSTTSDMRH